MREHVEIQTANGKTLCFERSGLPGRAKIQGGKMKRPDSFCWSWHSSDYSLLHVFGLYRGRLGDFVVKTSQVVGALEAVGATGDAQSIRQAYSANSLEVGL
jgi:hypothetical protein